MSLALLALAAALALDYRVVAGPGGRELSVEGSPAPGLRSLCFDDGVGAFVREAEVEVGAAWRPASAPGNALLLPAGASRFRYRLLLEAAARRLRDKNTAFAAGTAFVAPPSTWLARPCDDGVAGRYRYRVETAAGSSFASGVFPGPEPGTWEAPIADLGQAPWSAFGTLDIDRIEVAGARITLARAPGDLKLSPEALRGWVERSARAVGGFYGRFPVPDLLVVVIPGGRRAVGYGTTLGNGGAAILIWVGDRATEADLRDDWVLTHEMTHTALPNVSRTHTWLEEGLATYVEPLARAAAGTLDPDEAWKGMIEGMPRALHESEGGGLDGEQSIGGMYWGGALYCLLADVEIRERSGGRLGLRDALRGVLDGGGSIAVTWPLQQVLATADGVAGGDVLRRLYGRMGERRPQVDLGDLWRRLGVSVVGGAVRYDDRAPLAWVRKAICPTPRP
jgi:hypothetical protein